MFGHYFKTAMRQLLRYKANSIITMLCLAVGIVCYSFALNFIENRKPENIYPHYRRAISLGNLNEKQLNLLEELNLYSVECLTVLESRLVDLEVVDLMGEPKPFATQALLCNANKFKFYENELLYGDKVPENEDEVVISETFCKKVFGENYPIGNFILASSSLGMKSNEKQKTYRIVNVVRNSKKELDFDCYFSYKVTGLSFQVIGLIKKGYTLKDVNEELRTIQIETPGNSDVRPLEATMWHSDPSKRMFWTSIILHVIAGLILFSGIINFLKFNIQMFYNRHREMALRCCMGSNNQGILGMLFAEVVCMMLAALLLSFVISELVIVYLSGFMLPEIIERFFSTIGRIYLRQTEVFAGILLLCLPILYFPILRMRFNSISMQVKRSRNRHIFRNIMIGLQLTISLFFISGVIGLNRIYEEIQAQIYYPLSDKEESCIWSFNMSVRDDRMKGLAKSIIEEIRVLSEVEDVLPMSSSLRPATVSISKNGINGQWSYEALRCKGSPRYFDYLNIPMRGKVLNDDATNYVYVSEKKMATLQQDSLFDNMLKWGDVTYQIAGVYKALYNEEVGNVENEGSMFFVDNVVNEYYIKYKQGCATQGLERTKAIYQKYMSENNMPIMPLSNTQQRELVRMTMTLLMVLAVTSILLVVLSIYSAISLDSISRQKEVAIRKINGATPFAIVRLFSKPYIGMLILAFIIGIPLIRLLLTELTAEFGKKALSWQWAVEGIMVLALIVCVTVSYKIYQMMRLNPAEIIQKE